MLFKPQFLAGIADGTITLAFRRWQRPTVRAGGRLRTAIGELAIDAVDVVADEADVTDDEVRRAGFGSRAALRAALDEAEGRRSGGRRSAPRASSHRLYRIALRLAGPDPRAALRARDTWTDAERDQLARRLARLDAASPRGAWTAATLRAIAERPGVRAADLASAMGRDTMSFKIDVRKLKELGLTESLEVGYRLSARGRAWMTR